MVDTVRVTQQYGEVISRSAGMPVRVTQQYVETIHKFVAPNVVRMTQQYAEAISAGGFGINVTRTTQQFLEVIHDYTSVPPPARAMVMA